MAYEVLATESLEDEYDQMLRYLHDVSGSPNAARQLIDAMTEAESKISTLPESNALSRKAALMELGLREQLVLDYVVVYGIVGERVILQHIFHQRQDFEDEV